MAQVAAAVPLDLASPAALMPACLADGWEQAGKQEGFAVRPSNGRLHLLCASGACCTRVAQLKLERWLR